MALLRVISTLLLMGLFSCKPVETVVSDRVRTEHIQRLVPVVLPVETASARAMLECTAEGLVLLSKLNIETSRNACLSLALDSVGNLYVDALLNRDTVFLKSDSILISKDVVRTEVEYRDKPLTKWQVFLLDFGNSMFWVVVGAMAGGVVWLFLKLRK